ncbi:2-C-methyl-D-erythritol 4-phosphate cytidylyltransferase, chloroplastic [Symbiodinium microadriaticum]|uniref:2-C-methyl-D-erythritol 4-phosphate cytidylyltransferase, chloroplastic n=1 Tax=Symbiodinium microadriaticum TaxID=2951 RepID=A0A1Q9C6G9_SYMMI|nr:2-C-methyl-D-erythritol 4-phosphate cytidylyltransferase, chloroplastic [Symbiodinium microadriaticum]
MGASIPKQYIKLMGLEIALHSLDTFLACDVAEIVIVCAEEWQHIFKDHLEKVGPTEVDVKFTTGGKERQDSVNNGLAKIDAPIVAIHDGARPLVTKEEVERVVADAREHGAALLAVRTKATIKQAVGESDTFVESTPKRKLLWEAHTPQVIRSELLRKGFEKAEKEGLDVTDDVSLVEQLGEKVKLTEGEYTNIKVTTPEDIAVAETILKERGFVAPAACWARPERNAAGWLFVSCMSMSVPAVRYSDWDCQGARLVQPRRRIGVAVLRNNASDDVYYQKVVLFSAALALQVNKLTSKLDEQQSLLESEQDNAAASEVVRQQRADSSASASGLQEMQRQKAQRAQDAEGSEETLKQRYPRRWYDSIMPFQPPWDSRPTVGEVRQRLEDQTNHAVGSLANSSQIVDSKFCFPRTRQNGGDAELGTVQLPRLVGEYSTKSFQNKLGDMLQKEAQQGEVCDESPCRWTLAEECHADIFARYGFKSGTGVERLRPIVLIFQKFPDLADKVQKLWKLLGLKSSPAEFFIDDKPQEVSQELPVPQTEKRILSKARALAFQAELLGAFSAPAFQKKLAEMSRKHFTHLQAELDSILEKTKLEYGYEASSKGLQDLDVDMQQFDNDADIFVSAVAIEEALFPYCQTGRALATDKDSWKIDFLGGKPTRPMPNVKFDPVAQMIAVEPEGFLFRKKWVEIEKDVDIRTFDSRGSPSFQNGISCLRRCADVEQACEGYYHLRGRAELALPLQRRILPQYGFQGSRAGVLDMVSHCSQFITDPEVARLFDDINLKLGMTPAACARFRDTACMLPGEAPAPCPTAILRSDVTAPMAESASIAAGSGSN